MKTPPPSTSPRSGINVTPLIDIVLVLLIIFIVMVPGLAKALEVAVPQTAPHSKAGENAIVVSLDREGRLFLEREEISLASLADRLVPVVQLQPLGFRRVFLKVDEDALNQSAVRILDQIRLASDRARIETQARAGLGVPDGGGDIKVAISLLRRT
jgi:biopolymer transport protein ExbD